MLASYCNNSLSNQFSSVLVEGLTRELQLTPKPGLVDGNNQGSHPDLNFTNMLRSIQILKYYFNQCNVMLDSGEDIESLRILGTVTEKKMLRQFSSNTHRGAIFLGGLMLAAVHQSNSIDAKIVSLSVAKLAKSLFERKLPVGTKGSLVRQKYSAGGIIQESLDGLPCVFYIAAPQIQMGLGKGLTEQYTYFLAMAALMQHVEDTTTLKRCGPKGLEQIRADGKILEQLILEGADPTEFLLNRDTIYRAKNLTMGGVADLLGMSIAWQLLHQKLAHIHV